MQNAFMFGLIFLVIWVVFAVPTAVFLLRAYGRSKMSGFLWLFFAVVIWPVLAKLLTTGLGMASAGFGGRGAGGGRWLGYMMALSPIEAVIGAGLLLTSAIMLDRQVRARMFVPGAGTAPPPPAPLF